MASKYIQRSGADTEQKIRGAVGGLMANPVKMAEMAARFSVDADARAIMRAMGKGVADGSMKGDVLDGARPVFGPAARPLPQLPLDVDDEGFLIATGDFEDPVGPGFWDRGR